MNQLVWGSFESVECQTSTESHLLPYMQTESCGLGHIKGLYLLNLVLENKSAISTTLYTLGRSNKYYLNVHC